MPTISRPRLQMNRRRFVETLAGAGALALAPKAAWAHPGADLRIPEASPGPGNVFGLFVERSEVTKNGRASSGITVNGVTPAPLLRLREGEEVVINVHSRLQESTSIHWHGLLVPFEMDGVPGVNFTGIAPGTTFTYRFSDQAVRHLLVSQPV